MFYGERLVRVELAVTMADDAGGWDTWSEQAELDRHAKHEALLGPDIGRQREFVWGSVSSGYDATAGGSYVAIEYATRPWKRWLVLAAGALVVLVCVWLALPPRQFLVGLGLAALFAFVARSTRGSAR